jgi:hypothetical protein
MVAAIFAHKFALRRKNYENPSNRTHMGGVLGGILQFRDCTFSSRSVLSGKL